MLQLEPELRPSASEILQQRLPDLLAPFQIDNAQSMALQSPVAFDNGKIQQSTDDPTTAKMLMKKKSTFISLMNDSDSFIISTIYFKQSTIYYDIN